MEEIYRQAMIKLRGMWQFRWLGLTTAWLVGAAGVVGVILMPDRYEASARIFVNTASILKPLMTGLTVMQNEDQQIAMLSRVVISRPNVEKLVQLAGMDAETKSKDQFDSLVDTVSTKLKIMGSGRDNIYTLSFRDTNPERAKRVVQLFSTMFIESGHGGKATDTDAAKKFIDEQIAIYEKKLQEAENRLKEFKLRSLSQGSGEISSHFARMAETSGLMERAQLDLREAENMRDTYRRQLAAEESAPLAPGMAAPSAVLSELDGRIDAMRRNLDGLLQRYTESHPDVVGAQRVIRELEEQRAQAASSQRRPGGGVPVFGAPRATEQLKVSLATSEAAVASLRARVAEYSNRYAKLKAAAGQMPQLEAELAQLNRDYEVNKKNYETLVSRRESATISGDMQAVSGVADFRLIDPPRVSPKPVAPNRVLLIPVALLAALAAGLGAAYLAREIRPAFFDARSLAEATGLPILGSVSMVINDDRKTVERRSLIRFLGGVGALVGTYVVGFAAVAWYAANRSLG
ncbi:MAG: chain length-determining protein [Betaproteobacteria bacterium]|nr:chain length-determining protein [Betaproteobacteria bacterium]